MCPRLLLRSMPGSPTVTATPWGWTGGLADCRALAERRGWVVAQEYVDNDQSAYRGKRRPEYGRMMEDLKDGFIDAVVVWHLDRLTRHPAELESFFDAMSSGG